jgi:hypothetical protein
MFIIQFHTKPKPNLAYDICVQERFEKDSVWGIFLLKIYKVT